MNPTVGFIGLGSIGLPMASRIAEVYPVVAYDRDHQALNQASGVQRAINIADVASQAEMVFLCLPTAQASKSVVTKIITAEQLRARLIVELSTVGPGTVEVCHAELLAAGLGYVDAPVSGGIRAARTGHLSIMVAAEPEHLDVARPVLSELGANIFVLGDRPGLAQVMKLANNIIALTTLPITSEALTFGAAYGLDPKVMIDVLNSSTGRSHRSEVLFPTSILPGTYDYGALGEVTQKDVELFVTEARKAGVAVAIAEAARQLYESFVIAHPRTDVSFMHRYIERNSGA